MELVSWYVIFLALGLIFLPLTASLFPNFFDKGYAFSKILGLLILAYSMWLLSSLKMLPFNTFSLIILLGIFLIINTLWAYKKQLTPQLLGSWKIILFEEVLFLGGLIFWSYIKAYQPDIHGLEKFMDFGFINSSLKAKFMPPKDIWLAPLSINYYYFGHFLTALLTKLSGINSVITYNLMLATLFTLTLTGGFSIGSNLYHLFATHKPSPAATRYILLAGLLAAFLITLGGNLQTIYAFFKTYTPADNPVPFWTLPLQFNWDGYWYPNATRFIPFTIHEFPIYSFVVSDLHGHVLNIPFVLLLIALLIKIFSSPTQHSTGVSRYAPYILLGLLIATSLMTNVLDGPIYLLVIFLVLFAKMVQLNNKISFSSILHTAYYLLLIVFLALIFSLPFWLAFKPFASGIGILCAPQFLTELGKLGPFLFEANHCARSPLWMLTILWGFPYVIIFGFIIFVLKGVKSLKALNPFDLLVLSLAMAATLLILIPEFFYAKDIYPAHYRANTVFKFGYQAFIIFGLTSGYLITRLISHLKTKGLKLSSSLFLIFTFLLLTLVAIYPYFAVNSYFGGLKNYREEGLNGLQYLQTLYPNDYQAILWLRETIKNQPIILEAQGDSYTDFARVSANTGLPTVIGWPVHEWLWRGSYDEAGKRSTEVTTLYESPDIEITKALLKKYQVSLVFVGDLERQKYPSLNEVKFTNLGQLIFQSGNTRIYRITP